MFSRGVIVAPASGVGGAVTLIRLSGEGSIACCDAVFEGLKPLRAVATHTIHYGVIKDKDRVIDDVLVAVFRAPHSYTGEDSVEISAHGSQYIVTEIIELLCRNGARLAEPGEFSARAFAAGRIDLSQAEAVADIIAADSKAAHTMAATQMRGGYSDELNTLRESLIEIVALLELELDFAEEDVVFADRSRLKSMLENAILVTDKLMHSFKTGNAIRNGVSVAIVGAPNVGKSTLLNRLIGDERAMVSEIAGTTRDTVEESIVIDGIRFRFIDTAGIHDTSDRLEKMGIERTLKAIERAQIIINLSEPNGAFETITLSEEQQEIRVINKSDTVEVQDTDTLYISAKHNIGIDDLLSALRNTVDTDSLYRGEAVVSNARHFEALRLSQHSLHAALQALQDCKSSELLAEELRQAILNLGEITGHITSDDILHSIFSKFCVGK
ncbi:MAG: tRNA uridine-5-carboxymethylaminomethyl(34) synthesis GTPase MnmE [Alistipes sp.]|nr:tRNA uridine-5-carboxymethylaminomethyl(34) synthesis GTPase MnmE [Alistipes sp.]